MYVLGGEEKLIHYNKILDEMRVIIIKESNQLFLTIKLVHLNLHDPELMILQVTRIKWGRYSMV